MTDASVILPMTACSPFMEYVNQVCLRTLRESTDAEVLVLLNNTPDPAKIATFEKLCGVLGFRFEHIPGTFSQSRFWNYGIDHTSGSYVVFGNMDLIFYPDWLDHILELWREEPDYWAIWPWSFNVVDMGLAYRPQRGLERRIISTHHPAVALVMRRSDGYRWDEQFPLWEMDADFMHHCTRHQLKTGLCMWSRVDHIHNTVSSNVDISTHLGVTDHCSLSVNRLRAKWNL